MLAPDELSPLERLLLVELDSADHPLGGAVLHRIASGHGMAVSVSTVARRLRKLDDLGLTDLAVSDGRVLTEAGHRLVASTLRVERAASMLVHASEASVSRQLLDHLTARLAVEPAAAADAAKHRSLAVLAELASSLQAHEDAIEAGRELPHMATVEFHRLISTACSNALLRSMLAVVFDASLEPLQDELDRVIRVRDTDNQGLLDHQRIYRALEGGDPDAAFEAMRAHMARLVDELDRYQRPLRRR